VSISRHFTILSRADFLETLQSSIVASTPPRVYMTTRVLCLFGATEGGGREVGTPTFLHPVHLATVNSRCGGGSVSPADTVMMVEIPSPGWVTGAALVAYILTFCRGWSFSCICYTGYGSTRAGCFSLFVQEYGSRISSSGLMQTFGVVEGFANDHVIASHASCLSFSLT